MTGLFVDQLTVVDCSFLDRDRGIVGESWIADIVLEGELNDEGMVFDFGDVKKRIKQAVDRCADHKLVVPLRIPGLNITRDDSVFAFSFECARGPIEYRSPAGAVCRIDEAQVTPQIVQSALLDAVRAATPANVRRIRLTLRTEPIDGAYYHYSHGLKKHRGDCQRICHGHRSRIEIFRDGERDPALERQWADKWRDVYLVTREDIVARDGGIIRLGYRADQGEFSLALPAAHCDILPGDSTVELIADHIARELKQQHPDENITVKAYEGFNKGALSVS
jgi:6-pyruvoyl-tetrahydropterin synthase